MATDQKELDAISKFKEINNGASPDFNNPKDMAAIHALAYPTGLPENANMSSIDTNKYASLTNTTAPGGSDINSQIAYQYCGLSDQQNAAMGGVTSGANNLISNLQYIISKKENLTNPNIG